jgi:cyclophilin family peptidyl-prolyl cis-trans isomerase
MKKQFLFIIAVALLFSMVFGLSAFATGADSTKKAVTPEVKKYVKRLAGNPEIAIDTDYGTMKLELYRDVAPGHVDSMLSLIRKGFYNGLTFHRIIDGFMIQGGDPVGNGTGGAGYNLKAEFSDVKHLEGTLSMARSRDPNSASSQFFICLAPAPHLNGQYTVFGQLMEGNDVLHKIGKVKVIGEKPAETVYIRKMRILKDIPTPKPKK